MISVETVKAWRDEAKNGPSRVVYDDVGEDYKQRSVAMTFHYERYMQLMEEVLRLHQLNQNFQQEANELRQDLAESLELLRTFPGCESPHALSLWSEKVINSFG